MSRDDQSMWEAPIEPGMLITCLQVASVLTSTFEMNEVLELIMQKISHLVPAENWSLLLLDEETNELTFQVVVGLDKDVIKDVRLKAGEGAAGKVAETARPLFITDASDESIINRKVDKLTGFKTKTIVALPLKSHGKVLGVIEIINIDDVELFKLKEYPVLRILAVYAAIAIENARYFSEIKRISITDEYTGLYNARYMHDILEELADEATRTKKSFAVVFMDIDNFKSVVDTYGHLAGSQALREVGETISKNLTDRDILIKYGGDEYVLIFPETNKQEAIKTTNRIMHAIRESTYLRNEPIPIKLTASFGLAMFPDDAATKKDLLIIADNLMYGVKEANKNDIGTT